MDELIVSGSSALTRFRGILDNSESLPDLDEHQLAAQLRFEPRAPRFGKLEKPLHPMLQATLKELGIRELYTHQVEAIDSIRAGQDTLIASPTASGKTLCYNLPILHEILDKPGTRALYLFPLKALARDQLRSLQELGDAIWPPAHAAVYDGDTSQDDRRKLRKNPPDILLTNPDMLHYGILPGHAKNWAKFFSQLQYIVLDEVHTYRGIFGAHMAHLLRRLRRIARHHGADPTFVMCSATIGNPELLAEKLTGRGAHVVQDIGAPSPGMQLFILNPDISPMTLAHQLTVACVRAGYKTITFTKARRTTELLYTWIEQSAPELVERISSYRSGFLPEERREIERRLFSGELDAVLSTSALEVGIDVGGLDACILVGYPGSIAQTFQRAGRVGRGDREALVFLLAGDDALDQYFARHPQELLRRGFEHAILDPSIPDVIRGHLRSASAEEPLYLRPLRAPWEPENTISGNRRNPNAKEPTGGPADLLDLESAEEEYDDLPVLDALEDLLREGQIELGGSRSRRLAFSTESSPQRDVDIRGGGGTYSILDLEEDRVVGHLSGQKALVEGHPGAVYLHRGQSYLVEELDLEHQSVHVQKADVPYYTQALSEKETEILEIQKSRPLGNVLMRFGRLRITTQIHSFQKRRVRGQELLSTHPLELPPMIMETVGLWWEVDEDLAQRLTQAERHVMGSLHGIEHCAIGLMPLFALCDRQDLAGICFPRHHQTQKGTIFVYDGHAGGIGLAARGWELGEEWLRQTLRAIGSCPCEEGCPSCIQSPRCGSGNKPLDKQGSVHLLELMLGDLPLTPLLKPVPEPLLEESAPTPEEEEVTPEEPQKRVVVFDIETRRSAEDVGGWHNCHLMRVAIAVAYDSLEDKYHVYEEHQVDDLLKLLKAADLVVGYNVIRFDYGVLRAYAADDLKELPTLDLMVDIRAAFGRRIGLGAMCQHNLGAPKSADGLQSLIWFKEGKMDLITEYCKKDVELTWELLRKGWLEGGLEVPLRSGGAQKISLDWNPVNVVERLSAESQTH